jgi:hypothetical protein
MNADAATTTSNKMIKNVLFFFKKFRIVSSTPPHLPTAPHSTNVRGARKVPGRIRGIFGEDIPRRLKILPYELKLIPYNYELTMNAGNSNNSL